MKLHSMLIAVNDLEKSIEFYKNILDQEVVLDLGWNKFMSGFSIQKNFEVLLVLIRRT